MRDITTKFGTNAGKIYEILNEKGKLQKEKIINLTSLNDKDLHSAIGWLARENKISEENENQYKLDSHTNLVPKIGSYAGRVYKIIDIWEEVDLTTIKRLSDLDDDEIYEALGWLAREDKIVIDKEQKLKLK